MGKYQSIFTGNHNSEKLTLREIEELKAFKQAMNLITETFSAKQVHNPVFTINGTFDRYHNVERNKSLYFTFDTLTNYIFSTPCIINDYILNIQETDTNDVYDSHDIVFVTKQYHTINNTSPVTLRRIKKTRPNGQHISSGNLNIYMPRMSLIQISIGKNYNGSTFDRASIKCARIALTIIM